MRQLFITAISFAFLLLNADEISAQETGNLLQAIKKNNLTEVKELLDKGADIKSIDEDGDNVLMYAALYSTKECMQLLLKKNAPVDAKNKLGETALFWCLNDLPKATLLLNYHADVNAKTPRGNTPLLSASVGEAQGEMIKLLLAHGADAKVKNNRKFTTLMQVAQFGDTSIARLLLDRGVDMEAQAGDKNTALFFAAKNTNSTMVKWLLQQGANADSTDAYKAKALSYSVIANDVESVKALLSKTNNINEPDIDGTTILMWATYNETDNPAIIQLLLDNGATLEPKDKHGATALTWALKKGNTKTVALLQKAGAK